MKHHYIIFEGRSVLGLLNGSKTETRRLNGLDEVNENPDIWQANVLDASAGVVQFVSKAPGSGSGMKLTKQVLVSCPYGMVGTVLRVKEALELNEREDWVYSADKRLIELPVTDPRAGEMVSWAHHNERTKTPPIYMPAWACRVQRGLVRIRMQRLSDMTEEDALAEGVTMTPFYPDSGFPISKGFMYGPNDGESPLHPSALQAYRAEWDKINPKQKAETNPWLWALTMRELVHCGGCPNSGSEEKTCGHRVCLVCGAPTA